MAKKTLKDLTDLSELFLGGGTQVSDAGLEHLRRMTYLTKLNLRGTRVRGPGLGNLTFLANLRELNLSSTPVGDDVQGAAPAPAAVAGRAGQLGEDPAGGEPGDVLGVADQDGTAGGRAEPARLADGGADK